MSTQEHDDVVRGSFTQQVGLFSGADSPFARRPETTRAWLEPLEADMVVLDVACGAAHVAGDIAPYVRQVVGIDLTPALLAVGAERLAGAGVRNVLLQEGSAAALPFVDSSFDLVVCRTALHHLADPSGALAEMARVCRPDGRVVIADMVAPTSAVRDAFDELHRTIDPSHVRVLLEAELADLVQTTVGPLSYGATSTMRLPFDVFLTDAADRDRAHAALAEDLAGRSLTGFDPVETETGIDVAFTITVVHATPS